MQTSRRATAMLWKHAQQRSAPERTLPVGTPASCTRCRTLLKATTSTGNQMSSDLEAYVVTDLRDALGIERRKRHGLSDSHLYRRRRSRRASNPAESREPPAPVSDRLSEIPWLPAILAIQAGLSLRLVWANTAFSDESLYLWAGRLEWAHWLHGTPLPAFATYFSGAPVIYPPLGALANDIGGLAGARLLSMCFMLGATSLLYATTSRLLGRRAAPCAAAVFVVLGPAQVLSAFATYDAMAIFLLALATWLATRAQGTHDELFLVAAGLTLALADATKYASALWMPIVVLVVALTAPQSGWFRPLLRAARVVLYAAFPLAIALFGFGGKAYEHGILFTTLDRQAGGTYATAATVLTDSFSWIGIVFILALGGTAVSFLSTSPRTRWLCATLTLALLLAPLHQAQIHTTTSLHKHVIFGAWFGAIVAGYLLARAADINRDKGWRIPAVVAGIELFIAIPQTTAMFNYGWPNTSRMNIVLTRVITRYRCPCLVAELSQLRYYLPQFGAFPITGPFSFFYWSHATPRDLLNGVPAYTQAIRNHYFSVVEIDPAENITIYAPIIRALRSTPGYRLVDSIYIDHWGHRTMQIWSYSGTRGT